MIRFFHFFTGVFDWRSQAVCIRLNRPRVAGDKFSLTLPTIDDKWYVEDPFDLKHAVIHAAGAAAATGLQPGCCRKAAVRQVQLMQEGSHSAGAAIDAGL
jgi:hypothetical protein